MGLDLVAGVGLDPRIEVPWHWQHHVPVRNVWLQGVDTRHPIFKLDLGLELLPA